MSNDIEETIRQALKHREIEFFSSSNVGPRPKEGEVVIFADGVVVHGRGEDKRPEETIVVLQQVLK